MMFKKMANCVQRNADKNWSCKVRVFAEALVIFLILLSLCSCGSIASPSFGPEFKAADHVENVFIGINFVNLNSSPSTFAVAGTPCPSGPPALLRGGDIATQMSPQNIRLRSIPGTNNDETIVARISNGERVLILAGPQCFQGLNWYAVITVRGFVGWAAEGNAHERWLNKRP